MCAKNLDASEGYLKGSKVLRQPEGLKCERRRRWRQKVITATAVIQYSGSAVLRIVCVCVCGSRRERADHVFILSRCRPSIQLPRRMRASQCADDGVSSSRFSDLQLLTAQVCSCVSEKRNTGVRCQQNERAYKPPSSNRLFSLCVFNTLTHVQIFTVERSARGWRWSASVWTRWWWCVFAARARF